MSQRWDPEAYARNARFVSDLGAPVVELLDPRRGERVLDLGCGDGALTERLVASGCRVVGIDGSAEQVAAARRRGLDARVMDGEALAFDAEFDAVFSNAAMHWMKRADAVIDGAWRALVPGGRFVGEFGGRGCVATIVSAIDAALARRGLDVESLNPWYFPGDREHRERMEHRGFDVSYCALIERPTVLPGDVSAWLATFAQTFTAALAPGDRSRFVAEVRDALRPALCDAAGTWTADYVRLRFVAAKPL